ncbi:dienelactone hydrolase family protein [Roseomonas sp. AR75]|uniref:dienelactone hydrolase family protein n=1 Tax=Roseomonas sp. AR75 TaxID=2562311 RepID=UPI0014855F8A|nr:dienelactone hydrolase family protein [Roseomonas sp. AR75]
MRSLFLALGLVASLAAPAGAQDSRSVTFPPYLPANLPQWAQPRAAPPSQIPGTLRLPAGTGRVAAVIILHGSGGVDGRGEAYARALQQAGIASLEVDMFRPRGIGAGQGVANRPRSADVLPDVYGAARFLAADPRVDPGRLGVMGMSYGGGLSILVATDGVRRAYGTGGPDFRAALPIYPACWAYDAGGPAAALVNQAFPRMRMLILAGADDDYDADGGASCRKIAAAGNAQAQARAQVQVFPGATHGWDTQRPANYRDPAAARGAGGMVRFQRNAAVAQDGTQRVVAFFQAALTAR